MLSLTYTLFTRVLVTEFPASIKPRKFTECDIIVIRNGIVSIMDKATYYAENANAQTQPTDTPTSVESDELSSKLVHRYDSINVVTMNLDQSFLNRDVPMSSVVHAVDKTATISVTDGYSISISVLLAVSATKTFIPIEDFLSASFRITYTES